MKALELQMEVVKGISQKTGQEYEFNTYYVEVNGIKLQLKPSDNTVKQVLDQTYGKGE